MSDYANITGFILKGGLITLKLYIVTAIFSIPLAVVFALGKISKFKSLKAVLSAYTWLFRGTPLLLQLFFTYFGLPVLGIRFQPFTAAALTFVLNYAAYLTETFRAGIQSIDKGQFEAAKVLGMTYPQTMIKVILPQAIRRVLPPTCNEGINLIKDTALVAVIGMQDLLRAAKEIVTRDFTITPFFIAAVIYLIITYGIVYVFEKLEDKYAFYE
ncbi:arginine transport system permease protein ArtQ [Clostridium acetireducens DSM 10703]|uniref:Arginine transport system permease protein ArtQ n=1 Tax=Clostridium acetireducens DSM 10703 TaxID=1121290 RepID=A0A1E8EXE4_9CLOT|nr:amino acid ABC transporter permease [Clostridium acetireducens]OFI05454.1 arginine transport system permease protein ArtQ [Clostridium acetireducens DSM 10703]